jgi:hypothetical protein
MKTKSFNMVLVPALVDHHQTYKEQEDVRIMFRP